MSKVYVVELPLRHDRTSGQMVPARDLTDACRFGEIIFLLPPSGEGRPFDLKPVVDKLREGLHGFTSDDYLVAGMGHPLSLAAATALAAEAAEGKLKLLHWLRDDAGYQAVTLDLFNMDDERFEKKRV